MPTLFKELHPYKSFNFHNNLLRCTIIFILQMRKLQLSNFLKVTEFIKTESWRCSEGWPQRQVSLIFSLSPQNCQMRSIRSARKMDWKRDEIQGPAEDRIWFWLAPEYENLRICRSVVLAFPANNRNTESQVWERYWGGITQTSLEAKSFYILVTKCSSSLSWTGPGMETSRPFEIAYSVYYKLM